MQRYRVAVAAAVAIVSMCAIFARAAAAAPTFDPARGLRDPQYGEWRDEVKKVKDTTVTNRVRAVLVPEANLAFLKALSPTERLKYAAYIAPKGGEWQWAEFEHLAANGWGLKSYSWRPAWHQAARMLLLAEPHPAGQITNRELKDIVKQAAVLKVVRDVQAAGLPPIEINARLAPLIQALNAPAAENLDKVLLSLGLLEKDLASGGLTMDGRRPLLKPLYANPTRLAAAQSAAMQALLANDKADPRRAELLLGTAAYNAFVATYNEAAKAAKAETKKGK